MKLTRLLILPIMMLTLLIPQTGQAATAHNPMGIPGHDFRHQWLTQTIDKYAPASLAQTMKKDMDTHHHLMSEWRQSSDFKKSNQNCQKKCDKHAKKIRAIKKEQEQGKISAEQAHQKIAKLFHHAKFGSRHQAINQLRTAIKNNDRQAIVQALEQIDHHIQQSNKRLARMLGKTG
ncbi:hypothetical protein [Sporolactobacillus nakayamae]|uniref:DUF305 domain-containing protein n=1 Tax=Sporolactobacillus nakayamae TaxID=269670 RepID=A0A1I2TSU6_9BACL|nr:hypothetical protein [Sporolactobacillus nakayamae]SFG67984.1 hypothetical protein SAMN02982927_02426 [Sporolactobacillus nakayamae]